MSHFKRVTIVVMFVLLSSVSYATDYYVATDGNDSDNGLSVSSPWKTLVYAAACPLVQPGDTVHVKAGSTDTDTYSGNVVFSQGGTSGNPVVFEGYTDIPGDEPDLGYTLGDSLQAMVMPLFDGGNRAVGVAFDIQAPYVTIRNFQIKEYQIAVYSWGEEYHHTVLDNIVAVSMGALGGAGGYNYSGMGITLSHSAYNYVKNCVIVNANAEGISLDGNNNTIENTRVYSNETNESIGADGTDYYIVISGNNNIVRGCFIERIVPDVVYDDPTYPHVGHGIGFKEAAENNLVEDCTAKNLGGGGFYVRWVNARNNTFRRCKAYGADIEYTHFTNHDSTGFLCRNGAENNLFESCSTEGCKTAVRFFRSEPEGAEDSSEYAAVNNRFVNCIFTNSKNNVIDFNAYSSLRPDDTILNNSFVNCTMHKAKYLVASNRPNQGNTIENCIVSDVETLLDPASSEPLNISFTYDDAEDEDILGWEIYDNTPPGATISNVIDTGRGSRVIEFSGRQTANGYVLRNPDGSWWNNTINKTIEWSMNFSENYVVYIAVQTTGGFRYIYYTAAETSTLGTGNYIHHGLGADTRNGSWHTITRDLEADLREAQPDNELVSVLGFLIRGSGKVDDIKTLFAFPIDLDTDGDGITDFDEIHTYGTNPNISDTDGDGIDDMQELNYWGTAWSEDFDNDGIINLLDADSDNDGLDDGVEIEQGSDPADAGSVCSFILYEDAEDETITGWRIYDNDPVGAAISNVTDAGRGSHVIEFSGQRTSNGYLLRNPDGSWWHNGAHKIIEWSMKFSENYVVYIAAQTTGGFRYIYYTAAETSTLGTGNYIHHGLGADTRNGNWHTITRDLEADLREAQPDNELVSVLGFLIRGSGKVDDIKTLSAFPIDLDTDGDGITDFDEIHTYGTNPNMSDTDGDGIDDMQELNYWGTAWSEDSDDDGIINLIDADSDNDGLDDGVEIEQGSDPADAGSVCSFILYEDAEDETITGWRIYDNDPVGAAISNVTDAGRGSHVIEFSGQRTSNGYLLRNPDGSWWHNGAHKIIEWSMNFSENYVVYIAAQTTGGFRYIYYTAAETSTLGTGNYIHHGLGAGTRNGNWHTITRDLEADLREAQPDNNLVSILGFFVRGSGRIDDIKSLRDSAQATVTITEAGGGGDYECDGVSDQIEINAALDEVASDSNLTTVYLKGPMTCVIDEPVIISSNTIFTGDATATIKLKDYAGWNERFKPLLGQKNRVAWDPWGNVDDSISNVEISGFAIDAGWQTEVAGDNFLPLITFYNPFNISIHDMDLKNSQWDSIRLSSPIDNFLTNTNIYNNKIQNVGHEGICFIGLTDFSAYGNRILSTRTNTGILVKDSNNFSIYENIIGNSFAKNPSGYAGILLTNRHAPIDHAEIYKNLIYGKNGGIHLSGEGGSYDKDSRTGVHIHHNRIYKTTTATTSDNYVMHGGIKIDGYHQTVIENNIIDTGATDGIVYEGTSGGESGYETIVRNNIIINNNRFGINNKKPALHTFVANNNLVYNNLAGDYNETSSTDDIHTDPLFATPPNTLNKWYHIVANYDNASETVKIYINGKESASRKMPGFGVIGSNSHDTYLGGYRGIAHWFEGLEDELAIWDRALSDDEINELYHNGNPQNIEGAVADGLQAYLKMENNWEDSSGNGFNAVYNTSVFASDAIAGDYAGSFSGNSYAQYPDVLSTTNGITVSVWINSSTIKVSEQSIFNKGAQGNNNHVWLYLKNEVVRFELGNGDVRHEVEAFLLDPVELDYHLLSEDGRWDGIQWVSDTQTSPCIDAGYAASSYSNEPAPNGGRINVGVYGNTSEASKSN